MATRTICRGSFRRSAAAGPAAALVLALTVAGCGPARDGGPPAGTAVTSTTSITSTSSAGIVAAPEATVTAEGFRWRERTVVLEADDRGVKVVNLDGATHSFTAPRLGVDQDVRAGSSAEVAFEPFGRTGTVAFACRYHPSMTGELRFVIT
jgi:plastocyanin